MLKTFVASSSSALISTFMYKYGSSGSGNSTLIKLYGLTFPEVSATHSHENLK
jgi:ABC-type ATPase involved in cell division